MKWTSLENQSTTTRIVVSLQDGGNPVIKSTDRWDHGRLGMAEIGATQLVAVVRTYAGHRWNMPQQMISQELVSD
jgi:hypothetical protein